MVISLPKWGWGGRGRVGRATGDSLKGSAYEPFHKLNWSFLYFRLKMNRIEV
jgi:hypothetical protein